MADVIYAELRDGNGDLVIKAELSMVLAEIRKRELLVEGVSIKFFEGRGARCSEVVLDKY